MVTTKSQRGIAWCTILAAIAASRLVATPVPAAADALPGGTLDPTRIPKYLSPLVIPPAMPRTSVIKGADGNRTDYYEIALRQFEQQILPPGIPATTVWSYGSLAAPGSVAEGGSFHYPAFTIEAKWRRPVRVKWLNDLVDANGNFLPHLLPVDQTLHWANPPGVCDPLHPSTSGRDCVGTSQAPYTGPVPMIVHLHGAESSQESDGFPEAWFLPAANDIPAGFYRTGTFYNTFKASSPLGALWTPGNAVFQYPNDQRATTLWFHDHTLGMTRQNVYAGPAGFYLLRGGPHDDVIGALPGPAPARGDEPGIKYFEIPIVIQDRSFNADGSLFYPADRAFFEGLEPPQLQIPFRPDAAIGGPSDVPKIWNPEFFGNTMVVNGRTWPFLDVERRRYRLRFLNGSNSRFLILEFDRPLPFWQIGAEGGFLPAPVRLKELLIAPAERADVIVDFRGVPAGTAVKLRNLGPDEPFGGGVPGEDFEPADFDTTGQVMEFRVRHRRGRDRSTPPASLRLPAITPLGTATSSRGVSLNELESATVLVSEDMDGNIVLDPDGEPFGPVAALLGTTNADGSGNPLLWSDAITENPALGSTEVWAISNFTEDAHPIHIHLVQFEVVEREVIGTGARRGPEPWETAFKDTVIAFPGEITRVKARFDIPGLTVWHCHILEHEDNEMMRPFCVGGCPP
jgi:FtsP/CotA-like multicopper oxidase with cupredoxin domain